MLVIRERRRQLHTVRQWIKADLLRLQRPPTLAAPVTVAIPQNLAVFCVCGVVDPA
jgi:hypothetical protein